MERGSTSEETVAEQALAYAPLQDSLAIPAQTPGAQNEPVQSAKRSRRFLRAPRFQFPRPWAESGSTAFPDRQPSPPLETQSKMSPGWTPDRTCFASVLARLLTLVGGTVDFATGDAGRLYACAGGGSYVFRAEAGEGETESMCLTTELDSTGWSSCRETVMGSVLSCALCSAAVPYSIAAGPS